MFDAHARRLGARPLIAFALLLPLVAHAGENPRHMAVEQAYFECTASRSLQGGIFGKGPLRTFGPQPGQCSADAWRRVDRATFKARAGEWYGVDWSKDIPFFSEDMDEAS